nr:3C [Potamipivirus A]
APAEYAHLYKRCVTMEGPDGKRFYGMVTASKQVLTYKHYFKMGGRLTTLWYDNLAYSPAEDEIELEEVEYYDDKGVNYPSDCVLINFEKLPFNMKTGMKFLAPPKSGDSGVLIYGGKDIYSQGVENVQTMNSYSALIAGKHTTYIDGISYQTRNQMGMCGGLVCQKQNGSWKIIGMHHAGDSMMFGNAFRIKVGVVGQGV